MQIACEGHPRIDWVSQGFEFIQIQPTIVAEPVLSGESDADGMGVSVYGSVIRDGGVFRMWYQAWPKGWDGSDVCYVGCVESDDGIHWRRPAYHLVECCGSKNNHLTDLPFHCPSVFVDPHGDSTARFWAMGYCDPKRMKAFPQHRVNRTGYFTAHSPDGIRWKLDSSEPALEGGDVITSTWNPYTDSAMIALKRFRTVGGIPRRSIFYSEWSDGKFSEPVSMLIPDEFDDIAAKLRGFNSADYYGMGFLPTKGITVGFLWKFRHRLPMTQIQGDSSANNAGVFGHVDISLVYQIDRGGRWVHFPGRTPWMDVKDMPQWAKGCLYTSASAIDVGKETWLYFTGTAYQHGWYLNNSWQIDEQRKTLASDEGLSQIGLAKWQRNRLMGYRASLLETMQISADAGKQLIINAKTKTNGYIRAELVSLDSRGKTTPIEGYSFADCDRVTGDYDSVPISWHGKCICPRPTANQRLAAKIEICRGTLYAFDF